MSQGSDHSGSKKADELDPSPDTDGSSRFRMTPVGQPGETILVVDDEDVVRRVTVQLLESLGYRVSHVGSGAAALEWLEQQGEPPDLLVTDVNMPDMSGPELARQCRTLYAGIRILLVSGYTGAALPPVTDGEPENPLLSKPYKLSQLGHKVRELLNESS